MTLRSINPWDGSVIEEFEESPDDLIENLLSASGKAFKEWEKTGCPEKRSLLKKVAGLLRANQRLYAESITCEMGKPVSESMAEIEKCAWVCEYYADYGEGFLKPDVINTDADSSYVKYEPLGTVLGIMPWNYPFWQVFRFAVPTLMAGNTVVLKHASSVQVCARYINNIFKDAGFPPSVFSNIVAGSGKVNNMIDHPAVKAVSLTGSTVAGQKVAERAGKRIKKSVLELGGSNAFVVLDDADLAKAVETGIKSRMQNAGQSCIAAKRFILQKGIAEKFTDMFRKGIELLRSGDPMDERTVIGPLASVKQAETVDMQVRKSVEMGASVITGGIRENAFYTPTLVTGVNQGMSLFEEEVFGPVAPVTIARSEDEAISLANSSEFGLGISLFTSDIRKAEILCDKFSDGAVFINSMVKSDPRLPFGGTKNSGYGRELSVHGIREFVNTKTIFIKR
jgi:succinate-semialdehyde dehydrogenase/glutarate-semialdehyde dehydrogenase